MRIICLGNRTRLASDPDWRDGHVASCLRCQAEAVRYRSLRRQLGGLRYEVIPAPVGLESAVGRSFRSAAETPKKTVGRETAMAAAGLAAMAGALALLRHRAS